MFCKNIMRRHITILSVILACVLSCNKGPVIPDKPDMPDTPETPDVPGIPDEPDIPDTPDEGQEGDFHEVLTVTFDGTTVSIDTPSDKILTSVDGAYAYVDFQTNSVQDINIIIQGTTSDGGLKIYGDKKHMITLNGCDITSKSGPAINDQCHKRVFVHAVDGTSNRLVDASEYSADKFYYPGTDISSEDSKACFFSEGNMIFSGSGELVVVGNCRHAIASDGYIHVAPGVSLDLTAKGKDCLHANGDEDDGIGIYIEGGNIKATTSAAAGKCLNCDLDIVVAGGELDLNTTGGVVVDGTDVSSSMCIKSDRDVFLSAGKITCRSTGQAGKGIKAGNDAQKGSIVIGTSSGEGPMLTVSTTGSAYGTSSGGGGWGGGRPGGGWGGPGGGGNTNSASSKPKAMKATGIVTVNGGEIEITTTQSEGEGIESKTASANSIVLNGGNLYLKCADDCINSPGQIVFDGANVFAWSTGNDAVDSNYGKSGSITVKDGVVIAHSASSPEEALDCDNAAYVTISGGAVFTSGGKQGGGSGTPSHTQPLSSLSGGSVGVGYFTVTDSDGNMIMSCYVPRSISQNYSYISHPKLKSGSTYKYGVVTKAPSDASESWSIYYFSGGTENVSTGTVKPS